MNARACTCCRVSDTEKLAVVVGGGQRCRKAFGHKCCDYRPLSSVQLRTHFRVRFVCVCFSNVSNSLARWKLAVCVFSVLRVSCATFRTGHSQSGAIIRTWCTPHTRICQRRLSFGYAKKNTNIDITYAKCSPCQITPTKTKTKTHHTHFSGWQKTAITPTTNIFRIIFIAAVLCVSDVLLFSRFRMCIKLVVFIEWRKPIVPKRRKKNASKRLFRLSLTFMFNAVVVVGLRLNRRRHHFQPYGRQHLHSDIVVYNRATVVSFRFVLCYVSVCVSVSNS